VDSKKQFHLMSPDEAISYNLYNTLSEMKTALGKIQGDIEWTNKSLSDVKVSMKEMRDEIKMDIRDVRGELQSGIRLQSDIYGADLDDLRDLMAVQFTTFNESIETIQVDVDTLKQFRASVCAVAVTASVVLTNFIQHIISFFSK
jgi:hypothetical protein